MCAVSHSHRELDRDGCIYILNAHVVLSVATIRLK